MSERYPVEIEVTPDRALAVRWDDGHRTVIPVMSLRDSCPCATCRQARKERAAGAGAAPGKRRSLNVLGVATRYDVAGMEHVGRYALGVSWKDDHNSIYAWEYLAGLCPCEACAAERGGPPVPADG
jgi:DUF971 family protein